MEIKENIKLSDYTTFRIGGNAKYFAVVKNEVDLGKAVIFAERKSLPLYILGGGSNLLVSDDGVDGLVIKIEIKGIEFKPSLRGEAEATQIVSGAGEIWDDLVEQSVERGLYGLENLSYIPGTVGASVVQNIGAYGVEIKDVVAWVEVFDVKTKEKRRMKNIDCCFGYRDSIFKKPEGKKLVVLKVAYNLKRNGELNTSYKDFQNYSLPETASEVRGVVIDIRKKKLPDWNRVGTAGSFFKNPIITKEQLEKIKKDFPEIPTYETGEGEYKISLAYLLDRLGWKERREGDIGVHQTQPLAVVNRGDGCCKDIQKFANEIKIEIKEKFNINIEPEVVMW